MSDLRRFAIGAAISLLILCLTTKPGHFANVELFILVVMFVGGCLAVAIFGRWSA